MPKAIDLSTVSPEEAARILRRRESKKREYERRKEVLQARNREWGETNKERASAMRAAWRKANKERVRRNKHAYYLRNCEVIKARQKVREQTLSTPGVIRAVFCKSGDRELGLSAKDVPDELLETIRLTMLIKREVKQRKQVNR